MEFNTQKAIDYCDDVKDGTHESPKRVESGYKLITSKHIKNDKIDFDNAYCISEDEYNNINKRSKVDINDILFSMIGTIGLTHRVVNEPNYAIKNMGVFKIKDELKSKWLYYYLKTPNMINYLNSIKAGSTQQYITLNALRELPILYPKSRNEQEKIVKILDNIEDKIYANNQINNNLQKCIKTLYQEKIINDKKKDWKEINLTDIADVMNGYSYKGVDLVDESNIGMATIKNFERSGGFKEDGFKAIKPSKSKGFHYCEEFDILIACTDLTQNADIIGNAIMLLSKGNYERVLISMDLVKLIPKNNINKFMLYTILNSSEFKNFALSYTSGTTVLHLNKDCFKEFKIQLPEKNEFANFVEPMYKRMSEILDENRNLSKLRDTLLPKLMNGEIDLDKIEI